MDKFKIAYLWCSCVFQIAMFALMMLSWGMFESLGMAAIFFVLAMITSWGLNERMKQWGYPEFD